MCVARPPPIAAPLASGMASRYGCFVVLFVFGLLGCFLLCVAAGQEIRRLSVNLPAQESNLESLRQNDILRQLTRVQDKPKETLAAGLFGPHNDEHEFWTVLLLAALVLVLVEPFIANRTSV